MRILMTFLGGELIQGDSFSWYRDVLFGVSGFFDLLFGIEMFFDLHLQDVEAKKKHAQVDPRKKAI